MRSKTGKKNKVRVRVLENVNCLTYRQLIPGCKIQSQWCKETGKRLLQRLPRSIIRLQKLRKTRPNTKSEQCTRHPKGRKLRHSRGFCTTGRRQTPIRCSVIQKTTDARFEFWGLNNPSVSFPISLPPSLPPSLSPSLLPFLTSLFWILFFKTLLTFKIGIFSYYWVVSVLHTYLDVNFCQIYIANIFC